MKPFNQKRGVVFSLDAAIAVTVIIIILINSAYYFSTSSKESLSQLQPLRIGSDILAVLDYSGNLDYVIATDSVGSAFIDPTKLNASYFLPANYDMKISINDLQESVANASSTDPYDQCNPNCVLSPGANVKLVTLPIQTEGSYYTAVKTDTAGLPLSIPQTLQVEVNSAPVSIFLPYFDNDKAYIALFNNFTTGINNITFINNDPSKTITIEWFRVLGDDAYALETVETQPTNRFLGTGERIIAANEGTTFYGFHNVRYWIWLKSAS